MIGGDGVGRDRKRVAQSWKGPPSISRLAKPLRHHFSLIWLSLIAAIFVVRIVYRLV